jgi:hypothetical protein
LLTNIASVLPDQEFIIVDPGEQTPVLDANDLVRGVSEDTAVRPGVCRISLPNVATVNFPIGFYSVNQINISETDVALLGLMQYDEMLETVVTLSRPWNGAKQYNFDANLVNDVYYAVTSVQNSDYDFTDVVWIPASEIDPITDCDYYNITSYTQQEDNIDRTQDVTVDNQLLFSSFDSTQNCVVRLNQIVEDPDYADYSEWGQQYNSILDATTAINTILANPQGGIPLGDEYAPQVLPLVVVSIHPTYRMIEVQNVLLPDEPIFWIPAMRNNQYFYVESYTEEETICLQTQEKEYRLDLTDRNSIPVCTDTLTRNCRYSDNRTNPVLGSQDYITTSGYANNEKQHADVDPDADPDPNPSQDGYIIGCTNQSCPGACRAWSPQSNNHCGNDIINMEEFNQFLVTGDIIPTTPATRAVYVVRDAIYCNYSTDGATHSFRTRLFDITFDGIADPSNPDPNNLTNVETFVAVVLEYQYTHMSVDNNLKSGDFISAGYSLGDYNLEGSTDYPHLQILVRVLRDNNGPNNPDICVGLAEQDYQNGDEDFYIDPPEAPTDYSR